MAYLMIIDDDEDFAKAAAQVLRDAGHEVEVQLQVEGAIERMEKRPPDLIVLDVMFPEDSSAGFGLARKIRHETKTLATVPVLMLTAVNVRFPVGFGVRDIDDDWLPVTDFVEKPVDFDTLCARVQELLEKAAAGPAGKAEGAES
jgi:DNA-binding response OmpR family regulator